MPALTLYPTTTQPLPLEQAQPPQPAPAPAPPPEPQAAPPPPPEAAAPPQEPPASPPVGGTVLSGPGKQQAPPIQEAQQPAPQNAPPPDTGRASDALGATVSQVPGAILSGPGKVKDVAQATPGAVEEFTRGGGPRVFRPGDPAVEGIGARPEGPSAIDRARAASDEEARKLLAGDVGNIGNVAGSVKDVGLAHLETNMGEISPEGAGNRRALADAAYYRKTHNGEWPEWAEQPQLVGPNGVPLSPSFRTNWENDPLMTEIMGSDDPGFVRAYEEGFTTDEQAVYAPGPDALWEYYQSGRSGGQKAISDLTTAPLSVAADIAATALTGGGSKLTTEAAEQAVRLGAKQTGKAALGKGLTVAGRGIDAAATMGLSEAVPGAFTVLGKGYKALPWVGRESASSVAAREADALAEAGGAVLSERRMAEGQPGVPTLPELSRVSNPTPDPNVVRVTLPEANGQPPIDLTYRVDAQGKAVGVYDVVLPGPTDRYRRVTVADAESLYDAWGRLPNADRQTVRQAWFPELTRLETSPGEPFIEQAAERVFDRQGNLLADTGRVGTGAQREVDDLARVIQRDGRPDQIVTDFTTSWQKTLYDGSLHPLTRRSQAEHRLQTLKDALAQLPASYRTPEIARHVRQMEDLLPRDAPATIGTGLAWRGPLTGTGGSLSRLSAREASWLGEVARLGHDEFTRRLPGGRVGAAKGAKGSVNLVFDRRPAQNAPVAQQNGYATYLDLMDFRLKNPPSARRELGHLAAEVNGLRTAAPTPATAAREGAIADAVERAGIVPNASVMSTDDLVFAIEDYLRRNRPSFPALPGAAPTPPAGIYPVGSQDELWGLHLEDTLREALDTQIELNGTTRNAGQRLRTHWEETATAHELAKRQEAGVPLSPRDEHLIGKQVKTIAARFPGEYKTLTAKQFAALRPEEIDRLSASLLKADMQIAQGVRSSTGKTLTPLEQQGLLGKALGVYDRFIAMWRSTVLYNVARGVTYPMMQAVGNLITLGLTASTRAARGGETGILPYLNPREWKRSLDALRNPEIAGVPRAVAVRDQVGLGRTANLGRVSRDQIGARTGFNQPDSHGLTKALGALLGNQRIKDVADNFDVRHRQALWTAMFEPAYRRLKRDLAPMAEQRFARFAANAGVPLPIGRAQIDAALLKLNADSGGYFSQTQLRQALFEAGGGSGAANRQTLWNAADRIARDYKEELRKLDDLAQSEVDRVAFAGTETNAGQLMQRLFMFTWWIGNASRLYVTEAAKSPVQMALWARGLDAADRQEQTGANPRYKFFREFMATPAGHTLSYNPFGLLGTWLLGTTADPADERSVLTALGEAQSGGWLGDNLILSPGLLAAAYVTGGLGQDARAPDVLGINRTEREIVDTLNLVNHHLVAFAKTKEGNPERIPYPGVSQGVINRLARALSDQLPGTQAVAGYDPNASPEAAIASYMTPLVMRDNPDLDPTNDLDAEQLRHAVDLGMADHDSALYQEALGLYVDGLYQGPLTDKGSPALDIIGGIARRWVVPVPISSQPTERIERNERRGRDELRKAGSQTLSSTPERSALDLRLGRAGIQSPEGRDLALVRDEAAGDPQTQLVRDLSNGLRYATAPDLQATFAENGVESMTIQGYPFTAEQIASLPSEDRRTLAEAWLDDAGMRPVMDQYYENRTAQLRADKAFADAEGWNDYAKQYPGGVDRAVDDTAQVNPNFKAFIEGEVVISGKPVSLPELRVTDHAEWVKQVTQWDQVASVIAGVKDVRYGLDLDPKYAGVVAGLNQPVGAWYLAEQEARASGTDSEFVATMREDLETVTALGQTLDQLDAKWGQPVGTNRAVMAQRLIAGEKYPLDLDMKAAVEATGASVGTTLDNPYAAGEYLAWSLAQPAGADSGIDAYQQHYWAEQNAQRVPELAAMLATGQVPPVDATGAITAPYDVGAGLVLTDGAVGLGTRPAPATLAAPTILASEPGGTQGTKAPAGLPVQTGQQMRGSDGSVWVYVTVGGGLGGWINLANLAPAA